VYAAHFGLTERPFSLAPDPRYLFLSEGHREALAHLVYGLQGGGFVQLTGEVGTGKTTVCRALLDQLPPEVDVAMIFTPRLTAVELLASICQELHVVVPSGTTSLKVLVDALSRQLLDAHARGRRTVVIIDEAQNLSTEVLEELRLLTNIETTRDKLLQVILIGQPELVDMMQRPELRQLEQRVTARYHLRPFGSAETRAYIRHRLEVAGQRDMVFTSAALWMVHHRSGGVPRLVNNICDRALLGAFARGKRRVSLRIVARAASEVFGRKASAPWIEGGVAAGVIAAVLIGVTLLRPNALEYVTAWWASRIMPSRAVAVAPSAGPSPSTSAVSSPAAAPQTGGAPLAAAPAMPSHVTAPSTASPAQASAATAPATAKAPPRAALVAMLDPKTRDQDMAFATLFTLWGESYGRRGDACDFARRAGLRCLAKTGTWKVLRRLDLPVVLTLSAPSGDKHYATLTALRDDTATLDVGGETTTLPLAEIERVWDGQFVALWRTPPLGTTDLRPGMTGRDVAWLRQQLSDAGAPMERNSLYDDDLRRRVVAFQLANGLEPDGIAGDETLVRLAAVSTDGKVPSLTKARP
jgi:general secretion pathway protein A